MNGRAYTYAQDPIFLLTINVSIEFCSQGRGRGVQEEVSFLLARSERTLIVFVYLYNLRRIFVLPLRDCFGPTIALKGAVVHTISPNIVRDPGRLAVAAQFGGVDAGAHRQHEGRHEGAHD